VNIIGVSVQATNASAALIRSGAVVAAIEEEKLWRTLDGAGAGCCDIPYRAIEFCLKRGGIQPAEVDYVAYYHEPYKSFLHRISIANLATIAKSGIGNTSALMAYFSDAVAELRRHVKTKREIEAMLPRAARFIPVNHQSCHAAGAFFSSGFDQSAVVVAGNVGGFRSTTLLTGQGKRLSVQAEGRYPDSLGMVYTAVSSALGFGRSQENITMWLASTGQDEFQTPFKQMFLVDRHGLPRIDNSYFTDLATGSPRMSERFFKQTGINPGAKEGELSSKHRNVAASLQSRMTSVMCEIVGRHLERTRQENVCLAGGVALNSVMNAAVERQFGFERVFVEPVAGNAGASLGAGLYVWHSMLGGERRPIRSTSLFLGPSYDDQGIKSVLDNCKVSYKYCLTEDRQLDEVARLLSRGLTVAWFRGCTEFGPRALGARCILASPATEMMRDNLNQYIKHREDFRPFCAAVPQELASEFFEPSGLTSLLQAVCTVREDKKERIPAAVFGGGFARVHTIARNENPTLWKLLMKFGAITGTPVVLSTSFNLFGEPLVSSPREAVRGFYSSGIDCMAIGSFLLSKQDNAEHVAAGSAWTEAASCIWERSSRELSSMGRIKN